MPATAGKYGSKDSLTPSGQQKTAATEAQVKAANMMTGISKDLWKSTKGLRGEGIEGLEKFMERGQLPGGLNQPIRGLYRQGRENMEDQYAVAREQLLDQTPSEGGQLNAQLGDLAAQRARSVGGLQTQIKSQTEVPLRERLFASALGYGLGQTPQVALGGLNSGAGQFGNIAGRAQSEQLHREDAAKQEWQSIGQMAGMAMG